MADTETRDIAMQAKILIDHHMLDCSTFRENLREDLNDFRADIKKLNWRIAMGIGGLVVFTHGIDWILTFLGHK